MAEAKVLIQPQPGPQSKFLATLADIAFYGGSAGGGKSHGLLLEPLRHADNPDFGGVIFRRTTPMLRKEGALWDKAKELYKKVGAETMEGDLSVRFHSGMSLQFSHMEHESNIYDWQGAEFPFVGFDEVTHFTERQFFYMLSRLRSMSGIPGYVRATCNPDPDSWVREFLSWWIDPDTGFAIPERDGVLRYFVRDGDAILWADKREDFTDEQRFTEDGTDRTKSVTFIRARLQDNKELLKKDRTYAANLEALSYVDRMQLKEGNWNVRPMAGTMFKTGWFEIVDAAPADIKMVRYWDRASSKKEGAAYTAGCKLGRSKDGTFYVIDVVRERETPGGVQRMIQSTAQQDGVPCTVGIEQDPGQAGVAEAGGYTKLLAGFDVKVVIARHDKVTRAKPASAQSEAGNVKLVKGAWNSAFLKELQGFPDEKYKDQVDAFTGAMYVHTQALTGTFTKAMATVTVNKNVAPSTKGKDLW